MSTRSSLRRSRRAPKTESRVFNVGDLVEISRTNGVLRARLAQLLTERSATHPRWLIKFEGPYKDEEVYEHLLTKVTTPTNPTTIATATANGSCEPSSKKISSVTIKKEAAVPTKSTRSKSPEQEPPVKKTSPVTNTAATTTTTATSSNSSVSPAPSAVGEDSSVPGTEGATSSGGGHGMKKVSAREQRSRRRQAMIEEFPVNPPSHPSVNNTTLTKRKLASVTGATTATATKSTKSTKRLKHDDSSQCLKIKLLTGTLYLYRGRHRRAEFIRRV